MQRFVDLEAMDCCYLHAIRPPRPTIPRACRQNRGDGLLDCWIACKYQQSRILNQFWVPQAKGSLNPLPSLPLPPHPSPHCSVPSPLHTGIAFENRTCSSLEGGACARKSDVAMPSDRSSQGRIARVSLGSYLGLLGCYLGLLGNYW